MNKIIDDMADKIIDQEAHQMQQKFVQIPSI